PAEFCAKTRVKHFARPDGVRATHALDGMSDHWIISDHVAAFFCSQNRNHLPTFHVGEHRVVVIRLDTDDFPLAPCSHDGTTLRVESERDKMLAFAFKKGFRAPLFVKDKQLPLAALRSRSARRFGLHFANALGTRPARQFIGNRIDVSRRGYGDLAHLGRGKIVDDASSTRPCAFIQASFARAARKDLARTNSNAHQVTLRSVVVVQRRTISSDAKQLALRARCDKKGVLRLVECKSPDVTSALEFRKRIQFTTFEFIELPTGDRSHKRLTKSPRNRRDSQGPVNGGHFSHLARFHLEEFSFVTRAEQNRALVLKTRPDALRVEDFYLP